uniref:BTB domain-containing protein n=1 Tax=Panagrellus redivivus TaxID=6233 RepID=A0A7E4VXM5_PANRE
MSNVPSTTLRGHLMVELFGSLPGKRIQVRTITLKPRWAVKFEWVTVLSARLLHKITMSGKEAANALLLMIRDDEYDTINACHYVVGPDYRFLLSNQKKNRMLEQTTEWCVPKLLLVAGIYLKRLEWEVRVVDWLDEFFDGLKDNERLEYMHESAGIAIKAYGRRHYWYPEIKSDFFLDAYWKPEIIDALACSAIKKFSLRLSKIPADAVEWEPISKLFIKEYVIENVMRGFDGFSVDYDILEYMPNRSLLEIFRCAVPINAFIAKQMIGTHDFLKVFCLDFIALPVQDTNCPFRKLFNIMKVYYDEFCDLILNHPGEEVNMKLVMYNMRMVSHDFRRIMMIDEVMAELAQLCGYFTWRFVEHRRERYIKGRFTQNLAPGKSITMAVNIECVPEH